MIASLASFDRLASLTHPALAQSDPTSTSRSWLDWLLGLDELSYFEEGAELGWQFEVPAWGWVLIILAALVFGGLSYHRLIGSAWPRAALGAGRVAILLFIAVLIAGPMLVLPQEQVEPDWLIVLVDRSASMQIRDVTLGDTVLSRDQTLRRALNDQPDLFTSEKLGDRRVLWLGFDGGAYEIDPPTSSSLGVPTGQSTAIKTAIEQGLDRVAGRPVSGVVLFSDGRTPQSTGVELVRRLKQQAASVFAVPLGAKQIPLDLAIGRVDAPDKAFIDDAVPVRVYIDRFPSNAPIDASRVKVKLIDEVTGETLDEQSPDAASIDGAEPVLLTAESKSAGPAKWKVEVSYIADEGRSGELITDNNSDSLALDLIDRPIRVLYIDGYPRWEYRYLKNLLVREKSIDSSIMLISADPTFAQEGDRPIGRLPSDPAELAPFDVIIIGDVPAQHFTTSQMALMRDHVARQGAGVIWIGGEFHTPKSYDGAPIQELLPMRQPTAVGRFEGTRSAITMSPTPVAGALNVLRLRDPKEEGRGWPESLPGLYWVQDLGRLKPTAEPLAISSGLTQRDQVDEEIPMVVRMRYGSGESIYVATDETWRWRYGRGDLYFDQFWTQIVQMLGRSRVQRGGEGVWFDVSHRRVELNQPMTLELRLTDPMLMQRGLRRIAVEAVRADDPTQTPAERFELLVEPQARPASDLPELPQMPERRYAAVWRPSVSGDLLLRVVEPALDDRNLMKQVEVIHPDDELRQPATDHDRLSELAGETLGEVVPLDELDRLPELVPNRARRTPIDIRETLWDSPLALILALFLLTAEWVGRKAARLV